MRRFYETADYIHIDGMFLILLANLVGVPLRRRNRATSLDFFPLLADKAAKASWRIFYLGSKPGIGSKAAAELQAKYPALQIRTHHGYFDARRSSQENHEVISAINAYAPHTLLVGMGMPRQEIWIRENYKEVCANVIFPVGAFGRAHRRGRG